MRGTCNSDKLLEEILEKVKALSGAMSDEYMDLNALALYSKLSIRSLRRMIYDQDLPHFRVKGSGGATGKILVRRSEFDSWLDGKYRHDEADLDSIVARTMASLRGSR